MEISHRKDMLLESHSQLSTATPTNQVLTDGVNRKLKCAQKDLRGHFTLSSLRVCRSLRSRASDPPGVCSCQWVEPGMASGRSLMGGASLEMRTKRCPFVQHRAHSDRFRPFLAGAGGSHSVDDPPPQKIMQDHDGTPWLTAITPCETIH
ncbi:hypothetical protein SKAU_G00396740 [Synaphobranchus kaupii]|uniref:Uncharacterized protein n=1 Tax=Synaphobranchus kaupii TaxID=118154 RepID=A0A9Q1IE65_SYNKA|nr:hypothetical protein SKAU_G00396740 [Synaphobranchus kaupii]